MQTSIFLPLILMAATGGDGAEAAAVVTRVSAQTDAHSSTVASTQASTTASSPAYIMPNSHFRSQSGFQNGMENSAQPGVETGSQSVGQASIGASIGTSIGTNTQANTRANTRANAVPQEIFTGCRPAVLDPRLSSRILFDNRLAVLEGEYGASEATSKDQIFIARCGNEFVLFSRVSTGPGASQDALYLRFEEGSFQLVDQHWG